MTYLDVRALNKRWQATTAVDDVSFSLNENQFTALLGPSGCGKSTTLNMIAGLEEPTSGEVWIGGENVTYKPPGMRGISMVFQSYALFPHLSVVENIVFGLKARKVAREERERRLKSVLELVNLGAVTHHKPAQLSGGQCQRVALARAIVSQAPLCLMDEPLSNLDAKLRQEMRSEIRALQQQLGLAVLYVTHDQIEAMSMADEIILLNSGRIAQQGAPHELYNTPENLFTAGFIGHPPMNILISEHPQILLGVRPEHISLCAANDGYAVRVIHSDYHGADTLISVALGEQTLKVSLQGHHRLQVGEMLTIVWQAEHEHYFYCDSGKRAAETHRFFPLISQEVITC
ncbi:ABC transporter ATP-binding protein [Suttonella sp. R2A3]|uniref:ABC transporter ATP-binding protein n=1 Tax=Suttonella sp. R2A3 TaxID=2908648 RepID=UPI001F272D1A|nr:ABC transporter ATP-binding protein [Suttonella sp. R2A3]UJF24582.1 ABC transporter ATP-binding protein [Suttonella sp. R2A3]